MLAQNKLLCMQHPLEPNNDRRIAKLSLMPHEDSYRLTITLAPPSSSSSSAAAAVLLLNTNQEGRPRANSQGGRAAHYLHFLFITYPPWPGLLRQKGAARSRHRQNSIP
jgi:hypothetical protein